MKERQMRKMIEAMAAEAELEVRERIASTGSAYIVVGHDWCIRIADHSECYPPSGVRDQISVSETEATCEQACEWLAKKLEIVGGFKGFQQRRRSAAAKSAAATRAIPKCPICGARMFSNHETGTSWCPYYDGLTHERFFEGEK